LNQSKRRQMEAGKYYSFSISLESARLALCLSTNGDLFTIQLCHHILRGLQWS